MKLYIQKLQAENNKFYNYLIYENKNYIYKLNVEFKGFDFREFDKFIYFAPLILFGLQKREYKNEYVGQLDFIGFKIYFDNENKKNESW